MIGDWMLHTRTRSLAAVLVLLSACGSSIAENSTSKRKIPPEIRSLADAPISAEDQALLHVAGTDGSCEKKVPQNLRLLFFQTFRDSANILGAPVAEADISKYSKVIGMSLKESSGASASVTDMRGRGSAETLRYFFRIDNPGRSSPAALHSSLQSANQLLRMSNVRWDHQTNFGLLQMSADRFSFHNEGTLRAHEFVARMQDLYRRDPERAIETCGTKTMFKNGGVELREAFNSMHSCELGMSNSPEIRCFGKWAMLCPRYNVALALGAPPAYFATRNTSPLCAKSLRNILLASRH